MDISNIGVSWLKDKIDKLTDKLNKQTPVEYNQANRYLPSSVTSMPGYINYDVFPYMREILNCFDVDSGVREVALQKGVQVGFTTLLESGLLYYMAHVGSLPLMLLTADKELAAQRIENNILPMLNQSGFGDLIQSADEGNSRKTGKTKDYLQFANGGYLVPFGAQNANKMRSFSIAVLLMDECDAYPNVVGKDGDPITLSKDRCSAYWERRKIFYGSTPLIKNASKIHKQFKRGDQRKYKVHCKSCGYPQAIEWRYSDKPETAGIQWEMEQDVLIPESVCYRCYNCGHKHYEHDKEVLFSEGFWEPTARPVERDVRSYHLSALYSPVGFQPWYKSVSTFLDGYDVKERKVKDSSKYQVFYNNVLGEPYEILGSKVRFTQVSLHRRSVYRLEQIPNRYAMQHSGSKILIVTCQVDVHKSFLAVSIMGWCKNLICYVIDYFRLEDEDCTELSSPVWGQLRAIIEQKVYTADDDTQYSIGLTLIDAGYANATVTNFCSDYAGGVLPVIGRDRPGKSNRIKEFSEFTTQSGTIGYSITVDHYKDRLAPVLRREWTEEAGQQKPYHFNAPVDIHDDHLKELTRESRREKTDDKGNTIHYWYRPGNARNELWDLLVYGNAAIEILAWNICIQHFKLKNVDWEMFWEYLEKEQIYFKN